MLDTHERKSRPFKSQMIVIRSFFWGLGLRKNIKKCSCFREAGTGARAADALAGSWVGWAGACWAGGLASKGGYNPPDTKSVGSMF